jgi:hypothetical protein
MSSEPMSGHRRHLKEICESYGLIPAHDVQLEIHHKVRNRSNNAPENLQTLCANCHALVHAEICRITGISRARAREAASGAVAAKEAARHKAIGDPARMSILRQLQRTPELSVSDLIEELGLAHPTCRTI